MEDRELLELAAKAASLDYQNYTDCIKDYDSKHRNGPALYAVEEAYSWNPLTDDGDALRLAVKLQMRLDVFRHSSSASITTYTDRILAEEGHSIGQMSDAATRRAIVRAAAAMATARDA